MSRPVSDWTRPSCPNRSKSAPAAVCTSSFSAPEERDEETTLYVVGGLLEHAPATTAICNPTVNSYKRLVAAWDAPIYTVWSERSANALVRVPPRAEAARTSRCAAPIRRAIRISRSRCSSARRPTASRTARLPGPALTGSTYDLTNANGANAGSARCRNRCAKPSPSSTRDAVVRGSLGDHLYHAFRDAKLAEYESYRRAVHPWERDRYLRLY